MKISSSAKYALGVFAAVAILAGCSSGGGSQVAPSGPSMGSNTSVAHSNHFVPERPAGIARLVPLSMLPKGPTHLNGRVAPDIARRGIYVSGFSGSPTAVQGFRKGNRVNDPSFCSTPYTEPGINGLAVDGAGNLLVPAGTGAGAGNLVVGQGPNMCGAQAASIADPYGQPSDASSANALTGVIAVGNIFDNGSHNSGFGSISLCTVSGGCTVNLGNPTTMFEVAGVAMDNSGNCWASARDLSGLPTLTYFAGCTGSGVAATGYVNGDYGGIDIDASGNLITIDSGIITGTSGNIDAYSGCNPACTLLSTSPMHGNAVFGHLNSLHNNKFATGNFVSSQVDIYKGSAASGFTYQYSFNNGTPIGTEGAAYNKRSPQ
jgi:hypothetical protein